MNLLESSSKNSKELAVRIDDENGKKEIRKSEVIYSNSKSLDIWNIRCRGS
jgi:hypothetical protein